MVQVQAVNPISLRNLKPGGPDGKAGTTKGTGRKKGGLNRVASDLAEHCRTYTRRATRKIVQIMEADTTPPGVALAAAMALLDRGYGKPRQEHMHRFEPSKLTDDELDLLIQIEQRLSGIAGPHGGEGASPVIEGSLAAGGADRPELGSEPGEMPEA